jgi:hypothetical protein
MAQPQPDPLATALLAVRNGTHSQSDAAREFGVSRFQIIRAIKADRLGSVPRGRPPCIPREQEQILVTTVQTFAEHNMPLPYRQLQAQARALAQAQLPPDEQPTFQAKKKWTRTFIKRNNLKRLASKQISSARYAATTNATLTAWIRNLQDRFTKVFGSVDDVDPDRVYNMDETPVNPNAEGAYHIVPKDMPRTDRVSTGRRDFFTCVVCVNASGRVMKPMLIFEGKNVMQTWIPSRKDIPIEISIRANPGHSMNEKLFESWLTQFVSEAKPTADRPIVLILDNHDSHITEANITQAKKLHVHLFGLPKNSTSVTQPLDVGVFGPLKLAWRQLLDR